MGTNLPSIDVTIPAHSVKVLKILDVSVPPKSPTVNVTIPGEAKAGKAVSFSAEADPAGIPATAYHWDFGDGTTSSGRTTEHAYTYVGNFTVKLEVSGLDGLAFEKSVPIAISGSIDTSFVPANKSRLSDSR